MKFKYFYKCKVDGYSALSIILAFMLITPFSSHSWATSLDPQVLTPRLSYLDTNVGLNQDTINDIYVDKEGFVWIGTDEGLNRFDGVKVLHVLGPNLELSASTIYHIFEHSSGLFYLSTLNDGVISFDRKTQTFDTVLNKQYSFVEQWMQYADDIIELPDGNIIIALNEQVYRHNVTTKENTLLFQLSDEEKQSHKGIRSVYLYNDILLIGTVRGLRAHKLSTNTSYHLFDGLNFSIDAKNVKFLESYDNSNLIVGTVEGLYSIPLGEIAKVVDEDWILRNPKIIDANRNIWDIAKFGANKAYVATDIGLFELDLSTNKFTFLFKPRKKLELLKGSDITNLALDRYGNVWMGTHKSGAMYWSPSSLLFNNVYNSVFTQEDKLLSSNTIWSVHQHDTNTVFFATSNGLNKYNLLNGKNERFYVNEEESPQYTESEVYSLASSSRQYLWLGTAGGMRKFDVFSGQNLSFENMSKEIQTIFSSYIYDFQLVNKDLMWIINDESLYVINLQTQLVESINTDSSGLPFIGVNQFLGVDKRTNSLLVAASTSVWAIDLDTHAIIKLHASETKAQNIFAGGWVRGNDNTIWVTYPSHGLYKLDGDNYTVLDFYDMENHLPTNISYGLMFDKDADLWFSSHSGIHALNVKNNKVQSFSFVNGLAQSEFHLNAFAKLADGRMIYGGYLGFSVFNPNDVKLFSEKLNKGTSITEVAVSTRKLNLPLTNLNGHTIHLKHDDVGITLYFSSLNFDVISRTKFHYRITSDGETINYPNLETNKITLPLLSPGEHKIEVFVLGSTNEQDIATLTFIVSYPPFGSPLAYICYFLVACAFLGFVFLRQQKIQLLGQQVNVAISDENNRLKSALAASKANIWEWDSKTQLIRCERIKSDLDVIEAGACAQHGTKTDAMHIDDYINLIHKFDRENYKRNWNAFISRQVEDFDISYRIPNRKGKNIWYRDVGSCVVNGSLYTAKGTYTRLNRAVAAQEKLKLFGKAFKHTRDWVLIFNKDKELIATNPAFQQSFGLDQNLLDIGKQNSLIKEHQEVLYRTNKKLGNMQAGQYQKAETTLVLSGKEISLITDYSAIAEINNPNVVDYYLIIATDVSEQVNAQKGLQKLANYDVLTGLINRTLLLEKLKQSIQYAKRHNTQLAVLLIDIDKFDTVNETFGHIAGDAVLSELALRLREKFTDQEIIARYGSDEFVVVLEKIADSEALNPILLDLLHVLATPIMFGNQSLSVSAFVGVAFYPNNASDAEHLLENAKIAMYAAKKEKSKCFCYFSDSNKYADK